ncbi:MAG TPA: tetratricopeptide repeat protein [Solirubrobacterales bacterium]|nr:tetratricopeptide repeat protein [Solirubrobacterales bacterium]
MGKSTFVRRCREIARAAGAATAWSDASEVDLLEVMDRLAGDLREHGDFGGFESALANYQAKRLKLEARNDAPVELARAVGGAAGKVGAKLARRIPLAGVAFDFVDEEEVGADLGELAAFVLQHAKSRDDAHLLLHPVDVLSPLFVNGLRSIAAGKPIALFFDTYEETSHLVEPWVIAILGGSYGQTPQNVLLTLAGRYPLDSNVWAPNESLLDLIELQPLSDAEATKYLAKKGITDPERVRDINDLAQGVPIRLVSLVIGDPSDPQPSDTVVDRVLRSVSGDLRKVAIDAAIPRLLNRDIAEAIFGEDSKAFDWLLTMPFVEDVSDGWIYHSVIRREFLEYARRESPNRCLTVHKVLAEYHDERRKSSSKSGDHAQSARHSREAFYHLLSFQYRIALPGALTACIRIWNFDPTGARPWATTIRDAEGDADLVHGVEGWGEAWTRAIDEVEGGRYQSAIALFSRLLASELLEEEARIEALEARSHLYRDQDRFSAALEDIAAAEALAPRNARLPYLRAGVRLEAREFEAALQDCEKALGMLAPDNPNYLTVRVMYVRIAKEVLEPLDALELIDEILAEADQHPGALTIRGQIHRDLKVTSQAVEDFEELLRISPPSGHKAWKEIGLTYAAANNFLEAERAFQRALEAHPRCGHCWRQLARIYVQVKKEDEVVECLTETCADFDDPGLRAYRGFALFSVRLLHRARDELQSAVLEEPTMPEGHLWLAKTLIDLKELDDADSHLQEALRLQPAWPSALAARGYLRYSADRYREAEEDWRRVEELSPGEMAPIAPADRGLCLAKLGELDRAIENFDKALERREHPAILYNRAVAETLRSGIGPARPHLLERAERALEAESESPLVRSYGCAGLLAVKGEADEAFVALAKAMEDDAEVTAAWAPTDPAWSGLRNDPRFRKVLGTLVNPEARWQ